MLNSIENLTDYLQSLFGKSNIKVGHREVALPLYLKCYEYGPISLYGVNYVFVVAKDALNLKAYKAQRSKIEQVYGCGAVLVLDRVKVSQRRNMIENNIMFVEPWKQLFMPAFGFVLREGREAISMQTDRFTPQTQLVALFFLYNGEGEFTVKQIAEKTKLNDMAIGRGMRALEELKLISCVSVGRTNHYRLCVSLVDYMNKIEQVAVSPKYKSMWVKKRAKPKNIMRAGYSALSDYSMLADNEYETYAVSKREYKNLENLEQIEFEDLLDDEYVKIEIWKYDPAVFAENGTVDKFSLYMSFEKEQDERTEETLKKMKEEITNGFSYKRT